VEGRFFLDQRTLSGQQSHLCRVDPEEAKYLLKVLLEEELFAMSHQMHGELTRMSSSFVQIGKATCLKPQLNLAQPSTFSGFVEPVRDD